MFIAEGSINVLDFIKSGTAVFELFATEKWIQSNKSTLTNITATPVLLKELKKVSALSSAAEVIAILALPSTNTNFKIDLDKLTIALDNLSDPGNLGTIIRTADWFGIKNIYCSKNTVDAFNPKVVQATMGSLARVNIIYTDLRVLFANKPNNLPIFGAFLTGKSITEINPQKNGIILIGSEAHGISTDLFPFITQKITIPSKNQNSSNNLESLNASVANAIICFALSVNH